jgi:hypothetical protein
MKRQAPGKRTIGKFSSLLLLFADFGMLPHLAICQPTGRQWAIARFSKAVDLYKDTTKIAIVQ